MRVLSIYSEQGFDSSSNVAELESKMWHTYRGSTMSRFRRKEQSVHIIPSNGIHGKHYTIRSTESKIMDTSSAKSKMKVPDVWDFSKYLPKKNSIYKQRLSAYTNIVQNPELLHINVALTKRQKRIIRDSPVKFLNGSRIEGSILCSKYAQNFGIMGDFSVFPSNSEIEHNLQLEMSTAGPLVRYTLMMGKDLKNDFVKNVSAQLIASAACGLMPSTTVNQPFAIGAYLWAPFPFLESFRSHAFLGYGASPNQPSYTAGIGFSTQFTERGRIDLGYCLKTGVRIGIGFDYDN